MDKVRIIHDVEQQILTVWLGNPSREAICGENTEEVVLMKDGEGQVIGFELLHYHPAHSEAGLSVETIIRQPA